MLSKLQQEIVDNDSNVIFVEAAAASGKTAIIVEKIKKNYQRIKEALWLSRLPMPRQRKCMKELAK